MTNRFRIGVMALSAAIVAVGASALRIPEAHAARICSNSACVSGPSGLDCAYSAGYYCDLYKFRDSSGQIQYACNEGQC